MYFTFALQGKTYTNFSVSLKVYKKIIKDNKI